MAYTIVGLENLDPNGNYVFACNHEVNLSESEVVSVVSLTDIIVCSYLFSPFTIFSLFLLAYHIG